MLRVYPPEFRQRAIRMIGEARPDYQTDFKAIRHVASKLGIKTETRQKWQRRAEIDAGDRPGMTRQEHAEVKCLKRENAELHRANEILKAASAFSPRNSAAPRRDDPVH